MKRPIIILCLIICALIVSAQDSSIIVFQHANVIDGISDKPLLNAMIIVDHGKIAGIQKDKTKIPSHAIVIDLKGKWLLPGYIDAHVHFRDFERAQRALRFGVTTARTGGGGSPVFTDITIREAHRHGRADVPDILAAGDQVRPDMFDLNPSLIKDFPDLANIKSPLSGTENVRRVVKAFASKGVDHIKILATERAGTADTDPRKRTFTDEELAAIVDEAGKAGLKVMAHAHGDEGAYAAVKAGVHSIEHGTWLSDKTLNLMKTKGTWFVTNVTDDSTTFLFGGAMDSPDPVLKERKRTMWPLVKEVTKAAYKKGIHVVGATDFNYDVKYESGRATIVDIVLGLAEAGMSKMEAIKAITSKAAKLLLIDKRTGAIKKGLEADMVIVGSDPLLQLKALKDIRIIVNDGKIVFSKIDTNKTWPQKANTSLSLRDSVYWINISTDSGVVHAAVAMPEGVGPFPAIIILHGTHGFAQEYVQLAKRFAAKDFIGIAACWFAGRKGPDQRFITPIDFADAPPLVDEPDRFRIARQSIDSLIEKVTALPKIQRHQVALLGHARGAGACLDYVCTHPGKVQALILNSCGYPPGITKRAAEINVPVFMLHGTVDPPSDGSPFHDIDLARQFEDALKKANKDVEVKYYEGSDINALFTNPSQFDDTVERVSNFLRKKLKKQ